MLFGIWSVEPEFSRKGSDLGAFTPGYLGQTGQITSRQLASSTLATTWSYLTNTDDRRLAAINNVGLISGHFSTFAYTGAVNPTPNVGFTWDPYLPRLVSRNDGAGG